MLFATKFMKNKLLIKLDSLNRMFDQKQNPETITYKDRCYSCGCSVEIEISKTSGGFGLLGGVLYEIGSEEYDAICVGCYERYCKSGLCD